MIFEISGPVSTSFCKAAAYENNPRSLWDRGRVPDCVRPGVNIYRVNPLRTFSTSRFTWSLFVLMLRLATLNFFPLNEFLQSI